MTAVLFTVAELTEFAAASGDRNPLHLSGDYAHRTPFGERVVFGALSALRALAAIRPASGAQRPDRLNARFHSPLHVDRDYGVEVTPGTVSFLEHGKRLSTISVTWTDNPGQPGAIGATSGLRQMRIEAADPPPEDLAGLIGEEPEDIVYRFDAAALRRLSGGSLDAWADAELGALACASYLAGMEIPGAQALLLEVEIDFVFRSVAQTDTLDVSFGLSRYDARFGLLTLAAELRHDGVLLSRLRVRSLRRPHSVETDLDQARAELPRNAAALAGRKALVVGGSRGLGAQIVAQLALCGAEVAFTYQSSAEEADRLVAALAGTDRTVRGYQGDARDPAFWSEIAVDLEDGVDLVVCSAWPVFAKLGTAPSAVEAAVAHVGAGLAMVAGPLLAFLPLGRGDRLDAVVLSSELVRAPDPAYWHYATGKAAVEGLCRVLAPSYPHARFYIVRPSMLATDYAQSAVGSAPMHPAVAARIILEQCGAGEPGVHELDISLGGLG